MNDPQNYKVLDFYREVCLQDNQVNWTANGDKPLQGEMGHMTVDVCHKKGNRLKF